MLISRLYLKNWRNFRAIDIRLRERMFVIGPNAAGKSNLLDAFRFLREISTNQGGGLQKAVRDRGGLTKLRCLAARRDPEITLTVELAETPDSPPVWRYQLGLRQETRGKRRMLLTQEQVWKKGRKILNRPDQDDEKDEERLTQTHLEQISANLAFRELAEALAHTTYLHLLPQLLRHADSLAASPLESDPFGQEFLHRIADTPEKTRASRLRKIEQMLQVAVPQFQQLKFTRDKINAKPHLEALYNHWRPNAGWQREDQFSDGTLRLLGLFWVLLENDGLLLLEEPELSLNGSIVRQLPALLFRVQRARKRQVLLSTHSPEMLWDTGIDGREILLLTPDPEGTRVQSATELDDVKALLEAGLSPAEALLPKTAPEAIDQIGSFA